MSNGVAKRAGARFTKHLPIHFKIDMQNTGKDGKAMCLEKFPLDILQKSTNPRRITCKHCLDLMKKSLQFYECPKCGLLDKFEVVGDNTDKFCVICDSKVFKFR